MVKEKKYSGYGYHGGGRPATGIKRVRFQISCRKEELEIIKQKAQKLGKSISRYVLDLVL